jgi:arsenite oxidase small subunit
VTNGAAAPATSAAATFPKVLVTNVGSLQVNKPVTFNYPLDDEPSILVKVGQKAAGGVGPDGDIVAFSNICQHLGCVYGFQAPGTSPPCSTSFVAKGPMGYCCCHGSQYDFLNGAAVIGGPAPRPVPAVKLEVDSTGNIYAIGMDPPAIFGHNTGSNDVSNDLQGGTLVGGSG